MQHDHVVSAPSARPRLHSSPLLLLQGRLLIAARVAWLFIVALSVGFFLAGVPSYYRQLTAVCLSSECGWQLTVQEHLALQNSGFSPPLYATYTLALTVIRMLAYVGVALFIYRRRSDEGMALLASLWLVTFSTTETGQALVASRPFLEPFYGALDFVGWVLLPPLFLFTFPTGRFVPRWTRRVFVIYVAVGAVGTALERELGINETWGQVLWFGTHLTAVAAQVYRTLRVSSAAQRQQTKWFVFGLLLTTLLLASTAFIDFATLTASESGLSTLLDNVAEVTIVNSAFLIIPLVLGISILRYRLWDIDLIINRTVIWVLLSGIVVGAYVLVVGVLGALLQTRGGFLPSVLATGLIALLFHPLRQRVQRGVNRLTYGERDEPYAVLSRLGKRLEGTLAPGEVLPTIVGTLAQTLRLPYVAITRKIDDDFRVAAAVGQPAPDPFVLVLTYQGEVIGQLLCAPRSGGPPFSRQERRLLQDIARQVGVALHAVQVNVDLQRSRERLVITREDERRRIRRDLHDGLGPALASQTLKLGSARALLKEDGEAADALLQQLEKDSIAALKDIRRLVYGLRPPALDELGLLRAIEQNAPEHSGLKIRFELPSKLPLLAAAAEVAVYRIVQEALANVVRHSGASNAVVRIETDEELRLIIDDDGEGLPPDVRTGVGLGSMRERAEELGGTLNIVSTEGAGARIEVRLPLRGEEA